MKKSKSTVSIALSMGILLSVVPAPVWADTSATMQTALITQEKAETIARQAFPIPDGYRLQNVSQSESNGYRNQAQWRLGWVKQERGMFASIEVAIDAVTGRVLSIQSYQKPPTPEVGESISRDKARSIAQQWINKLAPEYAKQLKELDIKSPLDGPNGVIVHAFSMVRYVNGVPYPFDGVNVTIDAQGNLQNYNLRWSSSLTFPTATPTISSDKATAIYQQKLPIQLQYVRYYPRYGGYGEDSKKVQLVYGPFGYNESQIRMDAMTGALLDSRGNPLPKADSTDTTPKLIPISDAAQPAPATAKVDRATAEKLARSYVNLTGYTMQNNNYLNDTQNHTSVWSIDFILSGAVGKHVSVRIDATTGELLNFYQYTNVPSKSTNTTPPAISYDQAKSIALDFVKKALPTKLNHLAFQEETALMRTVPGKFGNGYRFSLVRLENGIVVRDNQASVMIDGNTGQVNEWYVNWQNDLQFPESQHVIPKSQAIDSFIAAVPLVLQYMPVFVDAVKSYESPPDSIKLVYAPIQYQGNYLDAVSGTWMTPWGTPIYKNGEIKDIKGHWAETKLQYFADKGLIQVKDGKVSPDQAITKGNLINILVASINGPTYSSEKVSYSDIPKSSALYPAVETALYRKWIDPAKEFHPNDPFTRAQMSELAVKVLGYTRLAEKRDIFVKKYPDVDSQSQYFGNVAILGALGIMNGDGVQFHPNSNLTLAEAVVVISRLMAQVPNVIYR